MPEQRRVVVGVTGAGGTRLAGVLLNKLVDVMVSANGRKLIAFEHGAELDGRDEHADAVDHLVVRILDQFGISAPGARRWTGL